MEFGLRTIASQRRAAVARHSNQPITSPAVAVLGEHTRVGNGNRNPAAQHPTRAPLRQRALDQEKYRASQPGKHPPPAWEAGLTRFCFRLFSGWRIELGIRIQFNFGDCPNHRLIRKSSGTFPQATLSALDDRQRKGNHGDMRFRATAHIPGRSPVRS